MSVQAFGTSDRPGPATHLKENNRMLYVGWDLGGREPPRHRDEHRRDGRRPMASHPRCLRDRCRAEDGGAPVMATLAAPTFMATALAMATQRTRCLQTSAEQPPGLASEFPPFGRPHRHHPENERNSDQCRNGICQHFKDRDPGIRWGVIGPRWRRRDLRHRPVFRTAAPSASAPIAPMTDGDELIRLFAGRVMWVGDASRDSDFSNGAR